MNRAGAGASLSAVGQGLINWGMQKDRQEHDAAMDEQRRRAQEEMAMRAEERAERRTIDAEGRSAAAREKEHLFKNDPNAPGGKATLAMREAETGVDTRAIGEREKTKIRAETEGIIEQGQNPKYLDSAKKIAEANRAPNEHVAFEREKRNEELDAGNILAKVNADPKATPELKADARLRYLVTIGKPDASGGALDKSTAAQLAAQWGNLAKESFDENERQYALSRQRELLEIASGQKGAPPKATAGAETRTVNGITYERVQGGWQRVK